MAVELNRVLKDPTLLLSYHFEKEEQLTHISDTLYTFPESTTTTIKFHETEFKPVRIYLTTVLHKGFGSHDFELIVEYSGNLFICFALKKSTQPEFTFPLKESPLEKMLSRCSNANTLYYQTSTKSHVFFCKPDVYVGDDFPKVLDNAKAKYKEIFEPNTFDIFNNLFTRNDYKLKIISAAEGGQFRQYTLIEGFEDSYMECELLSDENGNIKKSEYALTPLNANATERGVVTLVAFLHFLLVLGVGGIIFPWFQCYGYNQNIFKTSYNWARFCFGIHWSFVVIAFIMLTFGIHKKKRLIATIGFYFIILFLSNVVGMKVMFKTCSLYDSTLSDPTTFQIISYPMFNIKKDVPTPPL
jgi:hypothetical protein